jgi:hypothetical protein
MTVARYVWCVRRAAAAGLVLLAAGAGHAAAWDIDQLMQTLARARSERATFSEKKFIALLDAPVQSSGELYYAAPDRLEKRTLKPKAESMVLEQGTLTIERGRQKHRLQLQEYPELAAFIDSIRGTLAGDRKALERNFRLHLDGSAEQWTLQLFPLDKKMLAVVERIRMTGVRDAVRSVEVNQADGDSSLMVIQRVSQP